jgi:hypothetical protein
LSLAHPLQKFQDWFTQQWVILRGRKIDPMDFQWLVGPFGNVNGIGEKFITELAAKENLIVEREAKSHGLISSIETLSLSSAELTRLSTDVISFYEKTANYKLIFSVKWNPFFKVFGLIVNTMFSNRINQLNIPTSNIPENESLTSEIILLKDAASDTIKYRIWLRTFKLTGKVVYSGIYGTCTLPSGITCIKAIFPLPNGNATVIMSPSVGSNGELVLDSSGKKLGDAGFYFLVNDSKGKCWAQFIRSFRDRLVVTSTGDAISAEQTLTLWHRRVLKLNYTINSITTL